MVDTLALVGAGAVAVRMAIIIARLDQVQLIRASGIRRPGVGILRCTTGGTAINLLSRLGCKKIYLCGIDMFYDTTDVICKIMDIKRKNLIRLMSKLSTKIVTLSDTSLPVPYEKL